LSLSGPQPVAVVPQRCQQRRM